MIVPYVQIASHTRDSNASIPAKFFRFIIPFGAVFFVFFFSTPLGDYVYLSLKTTTPTPKHTSQSTFGIMALSSHLDLLLQFSLPFLPFHIRGG